MSTYMSDSLVGKVSLDFLDNNVFCLNAKEDTFRIKEANFSDQNLILIFSLNIFAAYNFVSKKIKVEDLQLNWEIDKVFKSYQVLSLIHNLDDNTDTYIIKIQINFEV